MRRKKAINNHKQYSIHIFNKEGQEESIIYRWERWKALTFACLGFGMDFHHVIVKTPGGKILFERIGENVIKDVK
jgi:hypothetical protein